MEKLGSPRTPSALRRRKGAELHSGGVEYEGAPRHHKGGGQGTATKREGVVLLLSQKEPES